MTTKDALGILGIQREPREQREQWQLSLEQRFLLLGELGAISGVNRSVMDVARDIQAVLDKYDATQGFNLIVRDGENPLEIPEGRSLLHGHVDTQYLEDTLVRAEHFTYALVVPPGVSQQFFLSHDRELNQQLLRILSRSLTDAITYHQRIGEEQARAQEALNLAQVDRLTGLHNRTYLERVAYAKFDRVIRDALQQGHNPSFAFVIGDIDKFKSFNDEYGHDIGDLALSLTGSAIRKTMSQSRSDDAIRYGGEELLFILYLPSEQLVPVAERIRQAIAYNTDRDNFTDVSLSEEGKPIIHAASLMPRRVTMSMGAAHAHNFGLEIRALYTPEGRPYLADLIDHQSEQGQRLRKTHTGTSAEWIVKLADAVERIYATLGSDMRTRYQSPEAMLRTPDPRDLVEARLVAELMKKAADRAVYQAKDQGRDRLVVYHT